MFKTSLIAAVAAAALFAVPATAATVFTTNFDSVPLGNGSWTTVNSVEGWTLLSGAGIEIQNNATGAAHSGSNLVELDSYDNSVMGRTIDAGSYVLSFYYSPRPGVVAGSNGIQVKIGNVALGNVTANGGNQTAWTNYTYAFSIDTPQVLSFAAKGKSDSLGGYIDTISLQSAVPEPQSWAMMILGFGMVGVAARRRKSNMVIA